MKVKVTEKKLSITEISEVYEGEFGINRCDFSLPKSFDGLSVTAVFNGIPVPLTDGKCIIPSLKNGNCILGVYAYRKNGEETELMYSPKPTMFFVGKGSFCREINEEIIPEVFSYETYCQMLQGYWRELFGENTLSQYKEDATEHQFYSAKAVNGIHQQLQEQAVTEEYVADQLADFKEKEADYIKIFSYNTDELKGITSRLNGAPLYSVNATKSNETDYFNAVVTFKLATAYKDINGDINYYVDTPLTAQLNETGTLKFENLRNLCDIGMLVEGEVYPLSKFVNELMDETRLFYYGKIYFSQSYENGVLSLEARLIVTSELEGAIDGLLNEFRGLLGLYGDYFLLYYKNQPDIEYIECGYTGGGNEEIN